MVERVKMKKAPEKLGNYFVKPKPNVEFLSSGAAVLDAVLGGGYPIGRIVNIVGDRSTGKSLLAIEACANFAKKFKTGRMAYIEAEAAFDEGYAEALGMPMERVDFAKNPKDNTDIQTVEDFYDYIENFCEKMPDDEHGLLILDSLDALSDDAEMGRELDKGTYGTGKAKQMSQIFRRIVQKLEEKNILLIIISQVRENLSGGPFAKKYTRSGGKALDFYASQILILNQIKTEKRTRKGVERPTGVIIKAKTEKNKIGLPFRECQFPILFGFGIDDIVANCNWLLSVKRNDLLGITQDELKKIKTKAEQMDAKEYRTFRKKTAAAVRTAWQEVEEGFIPKRKKY